jgi:hypothetical protein
MHQLPIASESEANLASAFTEQIRQLGKIEKKIAVLIFSRSIARAIACSPEGGSVGERSAAHAARRRGMDRLPSFADRGIRLQQTSFDYMTRARHVPAIGRDGLRR